METHPRDYFDRAVTWLTEQKGLSEQYTRELAAFRTRPRESWLASPGELPAEVFAPKPSGRQ